MRIGWATPLHHASRAARFSVGVAEALARRNIQIDLLRIETSALRKTSLSTELKVRDLSRASDVGALLRDYDLMVYNIGNDTALHAYAVEALMQRSGLCIFYDSNLFDLFSGWRGGRGRETAEPLETPSQHSTLEWLAHYALAAIVHDASCVACLAASCPGPVVHLAAPAATYEAMGHHGSGLPPDAMEPSFDAYADRLLPLAEKALDIEPLMRLGVQLGRELSSLKVDPDGSEARRLAQIAADLFCPGGKTCPTS